MLPRQPAWIALPVGSMTTTRSAVAQARLALEQRRQRALGERQLLAPEEDEAEVDVARSRRASASSIITASAPFMSAAPRPWTAPSSRRPGRLSWAGTVSRWPARRTSGRVAARGRAGEDAGVARVAGVDAARAQDVEHVGGERRLVARLRGDVDELEGAGGEAVGQGHAPAGYPASAAGAGRRPRRRGAPGRAAPARRACWASCRAGACCAG